MKDCKICNKTKDINLFKKDKINGKLYYRKTCNDCYKEKLKTYYYKNKQKYIDTAKKNNKKYRALKKLAKKDI